MKKLLLLLGVLFVSNAEAQIRDYYDDRVFYYDDYGWSVALSIGTVLYGEQEIYLSSPLDNISDDKGTAKVKVKPLPSFAVTGEYKPYQGLSFDTSLTYFSHNLTGREDIDVGDSSKLVWFVGGNYNFDEAISRVTPYITADVGLAYNFVNLNVELYDSALSLAANVELLDDSALSLAAQAGAGFDVNVGAVKLGLLYNYILTNGYELEHVISVEGESTGEGVSYDFDSLGGHKIELKGTIKPSVLN